MDCGILISANGLSRHYQAGSEVVAALDQVDFAVRRGEFIALVGPSGSGKSTLLNLVGALDRPTAGEISVDGLLLSEASESQRVRHRRESVGFIFQSFNLLPTLNAVENVETPMMLADIGKHDRRVRALSLLESVGLAHRAAHKPNQLSGGEKQRVAIARTILKAPPILVLDEATSALDSEVEAAIQSNLGTLMAGKTVIAIAHRLSTIARMDRLIVLERGRIVEQGTHAELLRSGGHYAALWRRQSGGFIDAGMQAAE
jgi:ATP-binding cassette, subfamily B, multidrug efflux pump